MKNQFLALVLTLGLLASGKMAFAAFSIEELHVGTKAATENFKKDNPEHVQHFTGYKTWKSGEDAKVKLYIDHGGMAMEYNYLCVKRENLVECRAL